MTYKRLKQFQPSTFKRRCGVQHNRLLASIRITVEHSIRRLKICHILSERYRNRRKRFGLRVNLIAAIVNFELTLRA